MLEADFHMPKEPIDIRSRSLASPFKMAQPDCPALVPVILNVTVGIEASLSRKLLCLLLTLKYPSPITNSNLYLICVFLHRTHSDWYHSDLHYDNVSRHGQTVPTH